MAKLSNGLFGLSSSRVSLYGGIALVFNSAYLAAYAEPSMFYAANVLLHIVLGLALVVSSAACLLKNRRSISPLGWSAIALLTISAALGVYLTLVGSIRPHRWALHAHIAGAIGGLLLLTVYLKSLAAGATGGGSTRLAWKYYAAALPVSLAFTVAVISHRHYHPSPADRIVNPISPPLSMLEEGDGADGPFFPSPAATNTGGLIPSDFFMKPEVCARCHADIYKQWFSSAHHFSSFNNQWYRKSIEYMQSVVGVKPSLWCAGCHDHAVFFSGMMQQKPIGEIVNTQEAQRGLTCVSCHSIVRVKSTMGQGDFVIEYPPLHDLATSDNKLVQALHDFLVYVDPEPHKKTFMKPFHRKDSAQFCASCHKVHLDVPVNNYRWVRGFNEYDNWQASGVSGEGARSFYYPAKPMNCVTCHMPLVRSNDAGNIGGYVHSHRFPGANTALPIANQDQEQLRVVEDFLKDKQVTVDIFAVSEPYEAGKDGEISPVAPSQEGPQPFSTFAVGEEAESHARAAVISKPLRMVAPINRARAAVRRGDTVRIDVVVRTRKVGHFFPGGTVDAFDVWLELQGVDDRGQIVFWSGMVEDDGKGPVEKGAHFYRSLQIDGHGNPINKRNAWATRAVVYVQLIPPGAADTVHFRMKVPETCGDRIRLVAKLNYRKFSWWNTQWAFAGIRDPNHKNYSLAPGHDDGRWIFAGDTSGVSGEIKRVPELPTVVMAQDEVEFEVLDKGTKLPAFEPVLAKEDLERWNDYGIGLLLQGDLKGAEAAFRKVVRIEPKYVDGWVNIARVRVQEGDSAGALEALDRALKLDGELAKTHFFYGMVLKARGKYDQALEHLQKASARYPRDRVVINQIGRIMFLQRRYKEAIGQFMKTLQIDPEDLQAHYNLMLCYQGIGDTEAAEKERKLYMRFKADEASQFITGPYRRLNPEDNKERQRIHEHVSVPLASLPGAGARKEERLATDYRGGRR